jgi:hypothetical protein
VRGRQAIDVRLLLRILVGRNEILGINPEPRRWAGRTYLEPMTSSSNLITTPPPKNMTCGSLASGALRHFRPRQYRVGLGLNIHAGLLHLLSNL